MHDLTIERLLILGKIGKKTYKICRSVGLHRLSRIYEYSKIRDFSDIDGCGDSSKKSLLALCYMYEKQLASKEEDMLESTPPVQEVPAPKLPTIKHKKGLTLSGDTSVDELLEWERISVRACNCCKNAGLLTLAQIAAYGQNPLAFYQLRNSGKKTVKELEGLCQEFKHSVPHESNVEQECQADNTPIIELSPIASSFFESEFKRLRKALSVRGQHLCETIWLSYKDLIPYFDYTLHDFSKIFKGKKKSSGELYSLLFEFKAIYAENKDKSDQEFKEIERENLFPFLMDRELEYISAFHSQHGRYPMLYILKSYFAVSSERVDSLYAYKFGILSGEHRTREEVANVYQLTAERVRQLIQNYKLDSSMAFTALEDWEYYSDNAPTVLTKQSSFYNETAQAENITEGYDAFVGLLGTIISDRKIRRNNEKICIKAEYEKKARLILDLLTDVLQEKYTRDTTIQLTQVVGQEAISMEIAKIFLSEVFEIEIHPGDTIEVKQGKIDVSKEIIEVLETFGHTMSLDDIYMFFKDKYPDHKYEEAVQLRPSIINSDEIVAIGKSGQYALKKWNTFTGCIKDCAYMILQEATEPMPDAELVEKVLEYFPNSSFRSIMSTLVSDPQERFTHYTDSSTWLVEKDHLTNKIKVRSRISSEDRFEDLKAFIATYKRWPFASGGDEEASLSRWIYNHSRRDLLPGYDPEEARQIEMLQEEYAHLPHNNSEYEFLNTCSDFKIFLQNNYRLPDEDSSDESELELAVWFRKTSTKREPYDDNRRLYFNELLSALEDYGFYFQ